MKRELDGLGKAGAIINIVSAASLILNGLFMGLIGVLGFFTDDEKLPLILFGVIGGLFFSLSIFNLIFNIQLLKGRLEIKTLAVIFGFIGFSWLGSVFLLVGKEEVVKQPVYEHDYGVNHISETLQSYKSLLDSGTITESEFQHLKHDLLNKKQIE